MEEPYRKIVERHRQGKFGERGIDRIARLFGSIVYSMEQTREDMKDVLGDLFEGGISYGEAGQYLTPAPICRLMARLTVAEIADESTQEVKRVCDPTCGSGRMLLGVAELHRHWEFHGQDIDLRCVRMTALNLALRNLSGFVIHGNTLAGEMRLVYETGRIWKGSSIRELPLHAAPASVQAAAATAAPYEVKRPLDPNVLNAPPLSPGSPSDTAPRQLHLF